MRIKKPCQIAAIVLLLCPAKLFTQKENLTRQAEETMLRATRYMLDSVSTNGGYVWYYLPDLSRRWGEMEAYKTMVWVQDGGTVNVGHMLLDAYHATRNEYFYMAAEKAAAALVFGQSQEGGWNYIIDFAGERSLKHWYNTIGKNGWRLEEFQHYYGNNTYDDDVTSDATRFLLRMYLEKFDVKYKTPLEKAISFILKSQYPNGGWPQRYPLNNDFKKQGHPDYSSFYTFNDDVIWENVYLLIQCYETLGEQRFLNPIQRGMNFYLMCQDTIGAWGQQYNMDMKVAGARTYEPPAFLPRTTLANCFLLLKFYEYTGDRKFLSGIPPAIKWLEQVKLPPAMTENGKYTHSLFVEPGTNKPIFVHRKGSNVTYGFYYVDGSDNNLLAHMHGKVKIEIQKLKEEYERLNTISPADVTINSPIKQGKQKGQGTPQTSYDLTRGNEVFIAVNDTLVSEIIKGLDKNNRWLVKHVMISHPYSGSGKKQGVNKCLCIYLCW
jgi:PelA/Pel-15E family pectate lyase